MSCNPISSPEKERMVKKALLVGINDYQNLKDLSGAVNDVVGMNFVLRHSLGFDRENIRILTDRLGCVDISL
jgi:hypothetical protein